MKKISVKNIDTWGLNNTFLNNQKVTERIRREIKKNSRNKLHWNLDNWKPMECTKNSTKSEVYSNTILPQETRKTSNRQLKFTPKTTGKTIATKIGRRKET